MSTLEEVAAVARKPAPEERRELIRLLQIPASSCFACRKPLP
jgi:hypothetical protein